MVVTWRGVCQAVLAGPAPRREGGGGSKGEKEKGRKRKKDKRLKGKKEEREKRRSDDLLNLHPLDG